MSDVWIVPTAIDTETSFVAHATQCVTLVRNVDSGLLVPTIALDLLLHSFAGFILALDVVDRLNAYSSLDLSGGPLPAYSPSYTHIAFAMLNANRDYDVEKALTDLIDDRPPKSLPSLASSGEFRGELNIDSKTPRGTVDAVSANHGPDHRQLRGTYDRNTKKLVPGSERLLLEPGMRRMPTGRYSQDAAVRRGLLLNQARAKQHARSVAIDAGLAATCAASGAAARAARLAQLQVSTAGRKRVIPAQNASDSQNWAPIWAS